MKGQVERDWAFGRGAPFFYGAHTLFCFPDHSFHHVKDITQGGIHSHADGPIPITLSPSHSIFFLFLSPILRLRLAWKPKVIIFQHGDQKKMQSAARDTLHAYLSFLLSVQSQR